MVDSEVLIAFVVQAAYTHESPLARGVPELGKIS